MKITNILIAISTVFVMSCSNSTTDNDHGHSHDVDQHEHSHEGEDHGHEDHLLHKQEEFSVQEDSTHTAIDSTPHKHENGIIHHDH